MLRVRDAMTRDVVTVGPEESAARAWGLCRERNIRHLPVIEGGRLVGIVSDRDLRDLSPPRATTDEENTLGWVQIRDMMSIGVVTAHPLDTIEHAAKVIYENKFNCLPVVADDELVGIITSSDLVRTLVELTGAHGEGSWIEVEVPNEPGQLASITEVIRDRHVNIASVFLGPASREAYRAIVLRLETTDPTSIAESLTTAGYAVTVTESTGSSGRYLERR
ncbi:MAG: CBS and ACT domain-containing protein [Actinobacteria bacterium]|nr:CBS and ACT domain-containing protein [Actinomycetota bacterium]